MIAAFRRGKEKSAVVVSIIIRPCQWFKIPVDDSSKLGDYVALPKDAKAVTTFADRDLAWDQVVDQLRTVLTKFEFPQSDSPAARPIPEDDPTPTKRENPTALEVLANSDHQDEFRSSDDGTIDLDNIQMSSFSEALYSAVTRNAQILLDEGVLVSSGLVDFDRLSGGIRRGEISLVAGRPRMGKTSLACTIAANVARTFSWEPMPDGSKRTKHGGRVAFFPLGSDTEEVSNRILSKSSGIPLQRINSGDMDALEFAKIRDSALDMQDIPLYIRSGHISTSKIIQITEELYAGPGLDLVIVDSAHLIGKDEDESSLASKADLVAAYRAFYSLARDLNVAVLLTTNLLPAADKRDGHIPRLSDLPLHDETIEYVNTLLFVVNRYSYLAQEEPEEGTSPHLYWQEEMDAHMNSVTFILAKSLGRNRGRISISYNGWTCAFSDRATPSER